MSTSTVRDLACQEIVELVTDYLEGAMDARLRASFEAHLSGCRASPPPLQIPTSRSEGRRKVPTCRWVCPVAVAPAAACMLLAEDAAGLCCAVREAFG